MPRFMPLADALGEYLHDGQTIAFEGFTHLIPFAAAHEAIRQGRRHLTVLRMTPDIIYDQMIGMGCVRRLVFSYGGNPGVGSLRRLRDAVENGWPGRLELEEHSHAAMANAYDAGAAGMPCAVFKGYKGTSLRKHNASIRVLSCPFSGQELIAVPAHRPDVTVIHAQRANHRGDVLIEGIIGVQKAAALAARHLVVTVEEVVDEWDQVHPNACLLPHWTVDAISVVPGGAHPSYAHGYYQRDNSAYLEWDRVSGDRGSFKTWMTKYVLSVGPEVFADRVEHLRDSGR